MIGLTRSLAREVGIHEITVNAVSPDLMHTAATPAALPTPLKTHSRRSASAYTITEGPVTSQRIVELPSAPEYAAERRYA